MFDLDERIFQRQQQRRRAYQQVDTTLGRRLSDLRNAYPWMRSGTSISLAMYGADPKDPRVMDIAQRDLEYQGRRPRLGARVEGPSEADQQKRLYQGIPDADKLEELLNKDPASLSPDDYAFIQDRQVALQRNQLDIELPTAVAILASPKADPQDKAWANATVLLDKNWEYFRPAYDRTQNRADEVLGRVSDPASWATRGSMSAEDAATYQQLATLKSAGTISAAPKGDNPPASDYSRAVAIEQRIRSANIAAGLHTELNAYGAKALAPQPLSARATPSGPPPNPEEYKQMMSVLRAPTTRGEGAVAANIIDFGNVGWALGQAFRPINAVTGGAAERVLKPVSRAVDVGLRAQLEMSVAAVRNLAGEGDQSFGDTYNQTRLGQVTKAWSENRPVDLGTGYVTGGQIEKDATRAQQAIASVDGHAWTPGRWLASGVSEPGDWDYKLLSGVVDGTIAVFGDPANYELGGLGAINKVRKGFAAEEFTAKVASAGGIKGRFTNAVLPDTVTQWRQGTEFRPLAAKIATTSSPAEIGVVLKGKVPAIAPDGTPLWTQLADAKTEEAVWDVLGPQLGVLEQRPRIDRWRDKVGYQWRSRTANSRHLPFTGALTPPAVMSTDVTEGFHNLDDAMRNDGVPWENFKTTKQIAMRDDEGVMLRDDTGQIVREAVEVEADGRRAILDNWLRGAANPEMSPYGQQHQSVLAASQAIKAIGLNNGADEDTLNAVLKLYKDKFSTDSVFSTDPETGMNLDFPGALETVTVGGERRVLPTPMMEMEFRHQPVPLPTSREIKRAVNDPNLLGVIRDKSVIAGDAVMQNVWIPSVLLRPAWPVRVIGENQVRMAAIGAMNLVTHPVAGFSLLAGSNPEGRLAKMLHKAGQEASYSYDAAGKKWVVEVGSELPDDVQRQMHRAVNLETSPRPWGDDPRGVAQRGDGFTRVSRQHNTEQEFARGMVTELGINAADEVSPTIIDMTLEDAQAWFRTSDYRKRVEALNPAIRRVEAEPLVKPVQLETTARAPASADAAADAWIAVKHAELRKRTAGGDPRLVDAIKTGRLNNVDVTAKLEANADAIPVMEEIIAELGDRAPNYARTQQVFEARGVVGEFGRMYNRVIDKGFAFLMSDPDRYINRSPLARKAAWHRYGELVPEMTPAAKKELLANATKAGIPKDEIARIRGVTAAGKLNIEQVRAVGATYAFEQMKSTLYDLHQRSQYWEGLRLIAPFGQAFAEILNVWYGILRTQPQTIRRLYQGADVVASGGSGFFYKDPQTGETRFTYPASAWMSQQFRKVFNLGSGNVPGMPGYDVNTSVPIPTSASLNSLNLIGTGMPGLGPGVQLAAHNVIKNKPSWDWAQGILFPYGDPYVGKNIVEQVGESIVPAYAKKILTGFADETDAQFAGQQMDAVAALVSSGDYDMSDRRDMNRLLEDAGHLARVQSVFRGVTNAGLPAAGRPDWNVKTQQHWVMLSEMEKRYRDMSAEGEANGESHSDTLLKFTEQYGNLNFLIPQSKSKTTVEGLAATESFGVWEREHGGFTKRYPNTYGLFGPGAEETFSYTVWQRQTQSGARSRLTARQQLISGQFTLREAIRDDRLAQAKKDHPGDDEGYEKYRKELDGFLRKDFPLAATPPWSPTKMDEETVPELQAAANDPEVRDTPIAGSIRKYLAQRKAMDAEYLKVNATGASGGWRKAKSGADMRAFLVKYAGWLERTTPGFDRVWRSVFEWETRDPEAGDN